MEQQLLVDPVDMVELHMFVESASIAPGGAHHPDPPILPQVELLEQLVELLNMRAESVDILAVQLLVEQLQERFVQLLDTPVETEG